MTKPHYKAREQQTFPRCVCGKLAFPSARVARRVIRQVRGRGQTLYAYRCPYSDDYHLTRRKQWDTRRREDV